jgi:Domain of unknown function (DUF4440)
VRDVTDEILKLEERLWTEADRPETFREVVADQGISVIEPMGAIDKERALSMPADAPWVDVEMRDVVIRAITPEVVVLAYHGSGRRSSDGMPYRGSIASTYVRIDGRWQLALTAHQPWPTSA